MAENFLTPTTSRYAYMYYKISATKYYISYTYLFSFNMTTLLFSIVFIVVICFHSCLLYVLSVIILI